VRSNPMPGGGFVTLYSDVTERRAFEAKRRQAQKLEVLGQLTGGVAHDFNNLLAAITGNLYLLEQDDSLSERGRRFATRASSAATRGSTLTRRLLAFARMQPLTPTALAIDPFIRDLADLIEYSVGDTVTLILELDAGESCAWVDRGQLENALLNLAINARDAMPGGGTLRLASRHPQNDGMITIEVADTGTGMSAETRDRVFEPFFSTKNESGSGLGLSIVYGFLKQSGGDIQIISVPGEGSTFVLHLPACPCDPVNVKELDTLDCRQKLPRQTLLLVEDNPDVRLALSDLLGAAGHQVTAAATGEEALQCLQRSHYSAILSDVDLNGSLDGCSLMRQIAESNPAMPRVLMSGLPGEILATRFGLDDTQALLAKPFTVEQFETALIGALEGTGVHPS
jgi:nitrogen-specific signal transduction histidine kinase/CheY-like chemotaxis protein